MYASVSNAELRASLVGRLVAHTCTIGLKHSALSHGDGHEHGLEEFASDETGASDADLCVEFSSVISFGVTALKVMNMCNMCSKQGRVFHNLTKLLHRFPAPGGAGWRLCLGSACVKGM